MLPTILIDFTPLRVLAIAVVFLAGYLTHELMHVIPLHLAGVDYDIEFAPGDDPIWWNLTFGRAFEFRSETSPRVAIISLMAPGILTIPGWVLWAMLLRAGARGQPISLSSALLVATWIIVFLPSLSDWVNAHGAYQRMSA